MAVTDISAEFNPLLEIDTSFAAYLGARTRSYKDHMVGGRLDYAFDADFSVKQKITAFSGWSKVYKNLTAKDIPNKVKRVFQSSDIAGSLKYSELYDAVKDCAEKLQISVPTAYVRTAPDKREIYSVSAEGVEPFIVVSTGLLDSCTRDELRFLVGCECGHIQNNHCIFIMSAPYFGADAAGGEETDIPLSPLTQISGMVTDWLRLADVTGDRAGMICLADPHSYPMIMASLYNKGVFGFYGSKEFDLNKLVREYETLHITPARSIVIPSDCTAVERRILAGLEFLSCEILYNWRTDLNRVDTHTVNKQALEVRCEIILDAAKEGM